MTYPLWISLSLKTAGRSTPAWINAGVGGNTSGDMLARIDRDVLAHHPQMVFFNAGINDLLQHTDSSKPMAFDQNVDMIMKKLKTAGIKCCVNGTTALAGPLMAKNDELRPMNAYLKEEAAKYGFVFADIFDPFLEGVKAGQPLTGPDNIHLTEEGYRVYVTAVLKVVAPKVPIAATWKPELEPGTISSWKVTSDNGQTLNVTVPESGSTGFWWTDQERQRGFVLKLRDRIPSSRSFTATATLHVDKAGLYSLKVGGQVSGLAVDGKEVPLAPTNHHWGIYEGNRVELNSGGHAIQLKVEDAAYFFAAVPAR